MLKLTFITIVLLLAVCNAQMTGNFRKSELTDNVIKIATWATKGISQFTGVEGVHTILNVRDVKTQVVAGVNYLLTIVEDEDTGSGIV